MAVALPPRIGLSTYREHASYGVWSQKADLLPATYAESIRGGGGVPMLLPPGAADLSQAAEISVAGIHGLVLAGGADVDPRRYGQEPHARTDSPRVDRDDWELALIGAAFRAGIPMLGVCRGLQLLNVALGGTLSQHLPDTIGSDRHCVSAGVFARHSVRVDPDSLAGRALGAEVVVASHHHQGIDVLSERLTATGWAGDGVIEAAELRRHEQALDAPGTSPTTPWLIAVQWHPEVEGGEPLFEALVAAAIDYRDGSDVEG